MKQNQYNTINTEVLKKIQSNSYRLVPESELDKLLSGPHHFCDMLLVTNATSTSTPLRFINNTNGWDKRSNTSISFEGKISKSPVGNLSNSLIQSRLYGLGLIGDISKAYLRIFVNPLDSKLRLFLWFDRNLKMQVFLRKSMDFGHASSAIILNIVQMKFLAPLLVYMLSFIIVVFAKYVHNYSFSVKNRQQYKMVAEDLKQAHEKISLQLKFICTANDYKSNEADTKIAFLGMEWCRKSDSIRFNGTFSIGKKNRFGMTKMEDISTIDKRHFRDLEWLRSDVTKRIILRLTMSQYDPIGCFLNITLTKF